MMLLDLPHEILITILSYLSPETLLKCEQTCKTLHAISRDTPLLQYIFALRTAGFEDNPSCTLSLADKCAALKEKEQAWSFVLPKSTSVIKVEHSPSGIYDFSGGVYLLGNSDRDTLYWGKFTSGSNEQHSWKKLQFTKDLVDLGLCVFEHDLIVVVTLSHAIDDPSHDVVELTLLQLSTGRPHPSAKVPVICARKTDPGDNRPAIAMEIVGDHIVLAVTSYQIQDGQQDHVFIYEWRSGVLKASRTAPPRSYASLVFLTPSLFLLPNGPSNRLEIYEIPPVPTPEPLAPCCLLCLPAVDEAYEPLAITCRGEPNPALVDHLDPQKPFQPSPEDVLLNFTFRLVPSGRLPAAFLWGYAFVFLIHRRSVIESYQAATKANIALEAPAEVPYSTWGRKATRWFCGDSIPTRWITTCSGQRFAVTANGGIARHGYRYAILDFNPTNVKRMRVWLDSVKQQAADFNARRSDPSSWVAPQHDVSDPKFLNTFLGYGRAINSRIVPAVPPIGSLSAPDPPSLPSSTRASSPPLVNPHPITDVEEDLALALETQRLDDVVDDGPDDGYLKSLYTALQRMAVVEDECTGASRPVQEIFVNPTEVGGSLPYVVCQSRETCTWDGVLLDDERLLGLNIDPDTDRVQYVDVHHF